MSCAGFGPLIGEGGKKGRRQEGREGRDGKEGELKGIFSWIF